MPGRRIATVLMLDVVGSTHIAAQLGDARYRELSSRFNRLVRAAFKRFGGKEEDHAGDGFFATFPQPDRAIRCAAALAEEVRSLGIEIRSGIHTGQTEDQAGKTHGIAVVIGARVMSLADAGDILVTSTTKELVTGSGFGFEDFSAHELKGVPGTWQVFAVTGVNDEQREPPLPAAEAAERRAAVHPSKGGERPPPRALIAAGLALLLAIAAIAFAATREGHDPPPKGRSAAPASETVVQIDPESGETITSILAGAAPLPGSTSATSTNHAMVVGQGGVWTIRLPKTLYHVDPLRREVRTKIALKIYGQFSINVAEGFDAIWVAHSDGLIRVHPGTDEQDHVFRFAPDVADKNFTADVAVGGGWVWLGSGVGELVRLDPATDRARSVSGLAPIDTMAFGYGSLWTADAFAGTVTRYDPRTMRGVDVISVAGGVDALVSGEHGLWALSRSLGSLTEIDVDANATGATVQVGETPTMVASGLGAVWVGDKDGRIRGVDEDTRQVIEIPFGAEIRAIAFDEDTDTIWIDVA
jgi:class 3 adenylate cyclase